MSSPGAAPFSEERFYQQQFRGRTMAIAVPKARLAEPEPLLEVLDLLRDNDTRVIVLATDPEALRVVDAPILNIEMDRLGGTVWRALRTAGRVAVFAPSISLDELCFQIASRLRVSKLVRVEDEVGASVSRGSFVHLAQLEAYLVDAESILEPRQAELLGSVRRLLELGVPAVNTCTLDGLHRELFSYAGSGTLFTRNHYIGVRDLGIEDYDAADNLISRGVSEGYLAPRSEEHVDSLLASAFGAFLDSDHLAGIGALKPYDQDRAAEICSLYTLTRFLGEGVGPHLVNYAIDKGRQDGLQYVFACTTSDRVGRFFVRHGFREVDANDLPAAKWQDYDTDRKSKVLCFRNDLVS